MWGVDLFLAVRDDDPTEPLPYSFYSSALRAATSLVDRGLLRSGMPRVTLQADVRLKMAYWLPSQSAPTLRRTYKIGQVEKIILREISKSAEPLSNGALHSALCRDIKADRHEAGRLRVPLHRALKKLRATGQIETVMVNKCWGETTSCYKLTLM
jgi:hypothetical protein